MWLKFVVIVMENGFNKQEKSFRLLVNNLKDFIFSKIQDYFLSVKFSIRH